MGFLRFFLALSVAVSHLPGPPFRLVYAPVAVCAFFIISGFYMAMVLSTHYNKAAEFYWARFTRLYPAYFAMAAVMVAWFWWTSSPNAFTGPLAFSGKPPVTEWENIIHALLNIFVFGQDLFELTRKSPDAPIHAWFSGDFFNALWMLVGQAWSLSTEAFFYLLAPFVVRKPGRIIIFLTAALAERILLLGVLDWSWVWGYYFPAGTMCFFFMGSLMYHLHRRLDLRQGPLIGLCMGTALAGWVLWSLVSNRIFLAPGPGGSIDGVPFWVFYVLFAIAVPYIFEATKNARADRWIGELSYPLYLVHGLTQGIIFFKLGAAPGNIPAMILAVSCSIAAAVLMRMLVEWPIERWRKARFHKRNPIPAV
jgi:peptidoglycan/LPS O-acetylase OafA/YrhL